MEGLQEFICYRVHWYAVEGRKFAYRNMAYPLAYPGMFFAVQADSTLFVHADFMKTIIHQVRNHRWTSYN